MLMMESACTDFTETIDTIDACFKISVDVYKSPRFPLCSILL